MGRLQSSQVHYSDVNKFLSSKELLHLTNDGIDIISRYTNLKKKGDSYLSLCPFHQENTPSFNVRDSGFYKCFGCGKSGNAISMVMEKENLSFKESMDFIKYNYNISDSTPVPLFKPRIVQEKEPSVIDFEDQPFTKQHHDYFNKYHLSEDYLREHNVFAVKKFAWNKKVQPIGENEYSFAYFDPETDYVKILNLNVPKAKKWKMNCPADFLWYMPKVKTENLFIVKSNKDALTLSQLGFNVCATTSENAEVLIRIMPDILKICPEPILHFGSDGVDAQKAIRVIEQFPQIRNFVTPDNLLKFGVNDVAEFCSAFSLNSLTRLLHLKLKL